MEVESEVVVLARGEVPSPSQYHLNVEFTYNSPYAYYLRGLINTGAIRSLSEYEQHAKDNPDYQGLYKNLLSDLVDAGAVTVDAAGDFILGESPIWHSAQPEKVVEYVPDISKAVCRRGNLDRSNPDVDKYLSFGFVMNFPDNPDVLSKLKQKLVEFSESLKEISNESHRKPSKNSRMVTLTLASAYLKPEDL
jgi:hypothetical protein